MDDDNSDFGKQKAEGRRQKAEGRKTHYLICLFSDTTEVDVVLTAEEFGRIDGRFMHQHFVVQMRSCSSASHAHAADNLALSHFLSLDHEDSPQVAIFGGHSRPVVNQNLIAVSGFSGPACKTIPSAAARTGVPEGAAISMPGWNAPSPLNGSIRSPKPAVTSPSTGQMLGISPGFTAGLDKSPNREGFREGIMEACSIKLKA